MISEKIVVIDDDPKISRAIKEIFREHEIIMIHDGQEAIEFFKKPNEVNVVLLDVYMREMNGLDILREIRKVDKNVAIIIMTAFGSKDVVIEALRGNASDFIEKPFDVVELRDKVKMLLKEKSYFQRIDPENRVDRIKRFVKRNYNNISLENIADEMCLSPKYISRMFKENNTKGFRDYKIKVKIEKGKELLETSSYAVFQIADKLGYQNAESFMRIFKRVTNITPTQYRKQVMLKKKKPVDNNVIAQAGAA